MIEFVGRLSPVLFHTAQAEVPVLRGPPPTFKIFGPPAVPLQERVVDRKSPSRSALLLLCQSPFFSESEASFTPQL